LAAQKLVVSRVIGVLKAALSTDVIDEDEGEVGTTCPTRPDPICSE
jgi:hypothetical protein